MMRQALLFAVIASSALLIGGAIGAWRPPSKTITAILLAFVSGALITAVAFELFGDAFEQGGTWRAGIAFLAGSGAFIVIDTWLDRRIERQPSAGVGFALLAAVTLDGVPENLAMGVSLIDRASAALLVAIFLSNLPESIVGAQKMRAAGFTPSRIMLIWSATALLLGGAVLAGYAAFHSLQPRTLAWPLGFAGGAVLASLADTLMPEAYRQGGQAWRTRPRSGSCCPSWSHPRSITNGEQHPPRASWADPRRTAPARPDGLGMIAVTDDEVALAQTTPSWADLADDTDWDSLYADSAR
jgi:ZIP family zinc transporter